MVDRWRRYRETLSGTKWDEPGRAGFGQLFAGDTSGRTRDSMVKAGIPVGKAAHFPA